jgi:protein-L-isoaspartate(D-aspartate) O-methyltransferase
MQVTKKNMIESQLKPEGISCSKTIDCISRVNREDFVPNKHKASSYAEYDIPLANNYSMLRPVISAKILQLLKINKNDKILEIGTGTGYLSCCLSMMGKTLDTVDIDKDIQSKAKESHGVYNLYNINYINEDVFSIWTPQKKYDVIVFTGSVDSRIDKLEDALNINGRMFVVIGKYPVMNANLIKRVSEKKLVLEQLFETTLDPLKNINKKNYLNF